MKDLKKGNFFGNSTHKFEINELTIVESEFCNYEDCPWHYHENAHFAFTTKGRLTETHKKFTYNLSAGALFYNHCQEPHRNLNYSNAVSALHVDIDEQWFKRYDINYSKIEGAQEIKNPVLKNYFFKIFKEIKFYDIDSALNIETFILQAVNEMIRINISENTSTPAWILKLKDFLYDRFNEKISLNEIALQLDIHPVYLCQRFPYYFRTSLGDYIRKIKIEKSVELILNKPNLSLTEITYLCGFSDQSHFIRLFKKYVDITPSAFRKLIQ